jgi:branched-subunit amino acid aminotransferase/4-amino-4-deoxychorismate lyase
MHYYLADRRARARDPGSRALLLDEDGFVAETTTANIVICNHDRGLSMPQRDKVLPGISLAVLVELADRLKVPHSERDFAPAELAAADEVFLTSTSPCILPVLRFEGRPIGGPEPGPVFKRFLAEWSSLVGLEIADQARRWATR